VPKAELLSSNEALRRFGELWKLQKEDVMMMLAIVEYEYRANKTYTSGEIAILKKVLSEICKFLNGCAKEWEEFERKKLK